MMLRILMIASFLAPLSMSCDMKNPLQTPAQEGEKGESSLRENDGPVCSSQEEAYVLATDRHGFILSSPNEDWVLRDSPKAEPGDEDLKFVLYHNKKAGTISAVSKRVKTPVSELIAADHRVASQDAELRVSNVVVREDGKRADFLVVTEREGQVVAAHEAMLVVPGTEDLVLVLFLVAPADVFPELNEDFEAIVDSAKSAE